MAFAVTLTALLGACQSAPSSDYSEYHTRLDASTAQIELPLEQYAMSASEQQLVARANAVLLKECMAEEGEEFPRADIDWDSLPLLPDRRYGLWSTTDAQLNGYEFPSSESSSAVDEAEAALGPEWLQAATVCLSKTESLAVMGANTSPDQSVVDRGMNESFDALLASGDFKAQKTAWLKCIEEQGLSLYPDARVLVPSFPPSGEAQLKVATIDVDCKEKLNSVQLIADMESRTQLKYRDEHEGELVSYRADADKVIENAKQILGQ